MIRVHGIGAAVFAVALGAAGLPAQGSPETIRIGDRVTGRIAPSDPDAFGRGPFRAYQLDLREGDRVVALASAMAFDTYLVLGRMAGPVFDQVAFDDDGGGGTDSRLRFVARRTGRYLLLVQSFAADGAGAFTLSLQRAPEPTTGAPRAIAFGQALEGTLAETDREDDERGRYHDVYTFRGTAGQRIEANLVSEAFDAYLELGRVEGGSTVRIAHDDDGGEGRDARLRHVLPADGEYVLHATSFRPGATGGYRISLDDRPMPSVDPRPLPRGTTVRGELEEGLPELDDGPFYQEWTFHGEEGERVRITLRSDDFDTYLYVGRLRDGRFRQVASNDDHGDGTDSRVEVTLPATGEYRVRASSFGEGETGEYTLLLEGAPR
jgi:hypothetical protein